MWTEEHSSFGECMCNVRMCAAWAPYTHTHTQWHTHSGTYTVTHTQWHTHTHTVTHTHRVTHTHTQWYTHSVTHTHTHTQWHTHTVTYTHTQRHTRTHTHTVTHTQWHTHIQWHMHGDTQTHTVTHTHKWHPQVTPTHKWHMCHLVLVHAVGFGLCVCPHYSSSLFLHPPTPSLDPSFCSLSPLRLSMRHYGLLPVSSWCVGLEIPRGHQFSHCGLVQEMVQVRLACGEYSNVAMMIVCEGWGVLEWDCSVVLSPPLLPCLSPTHTTSDYHVEVCYKCRPMVERDGKLYCSDNSLGPSTSQPTVWSLS